MAAGAITVNTSFYFSATMMSSLSDNGVGQIYAVGECTNSSTSTTDSMGRWWDPRYGWATAYDVYAGVACSTNDVYDVSFRGVALGEGLLYLAWETGSAYTAHVISPDGVCLPVPLPSNLRGAPYASAGLQDKAGGYYVFSYSGSLRYCRDLRAYTANLVYFAARVS
jgi:hypothetical protein